MDKRMKKICSIIGVICFLSLVVSCSKEEEYGLKDVNFYFDYRGDWSYVEPEETTVVADSLRLKFYLLKADGTPSHEFGCGENIVFQFSIENLAKEKRIIRSDSGIGSLFYDLFMVYRKSDNEYVGRPWDSLFGNDLGGGMSLEPEIKRLWRCAWQVGTEIPFAGYMLYFGHYPKRPDLPAGTYYARVSVDISEYQYPSYRTRSSDDSKNLQTLDYEFVVK